MSLETACAGAQECGVRVKEEREEETDGQQEHTHMKVEWGEGTDAQREHGLEIKVEVEEKIIGRQECGVYIKEQSEWTRDLDLGSKSDVKEESEGVELYAGHKVEADLALGPAGPQPPDDAFAQPSTATGSRGVDLNEEPPPGPASPLLVLKKPYSCDVCMKQYCKKKYLARHIRTHPDEKLYSCNVCMKQFSKKNYLARHIRTHSDEKLYSCDVCMKRFSMKHYLARHIRKHSDVRRYSCDTCHKQFKLKISLVAHMRLHTGAFYSCDKCKKQFVREASLVGHLRTHTGERPHSCDMCGLKFFRKQYLQAHKRRIHNPHAPVEKHFSCDVCKIQYERKHHFLAHIRIHTGEDPYSCNRCELKFTSRRSVDKHSRRAHGGRGAGAGAGAGGTARQYPAAAPRRDPRRRLPQRAANMSVIYIKQETD